MLLPLLNLKICYGGYFNRDQDLFDANEWNIFLYLKKDKIKDSFVCGSYFISIEIRTF